MLRELTTLNFKWRELIKIIPSLLTVREISLLEFEELCRIQRHILGPVKYVTRTFFVRKTNGFKVMLSTIISKSFIADV